MINLNSEEFKIINWGLLYFYDDEISNLLLAEKKIIINSENYSISLINELREKIENDRKLRTKPTNYEEGSIQAEYYDYQYGNTEKVINQILQNYRKASLLSIFSVLEGQLKLLSTFIQDEFDFSVKIKHITGSDYTHKYWLYLTKVFEINSIGVRDQYNLIQQTRYIRNKIAHNNSKIEYNRLPYVKQTKGLAIKKLGCDYIVEINDIDYLIRFIDLIQSFFNKLIGAVDRRYGELITLKQ